ncbi:MAG: PepSY-like domain-containing protein [Bacteroidetes bacterium]|nr:PepSY-like domain-containing protein [Bacteroidota bacterium]
MKKLILLLFVAMVAFSCSKNKTATVTENNLNLSDLPVTITSYVADNYPDATIYQAVKLENSPAQYVITLNTEEELAFDKVGNFLGDGSKFPGGPDGPGCPGDSLHPGPGPDPGHGHGHGHHHGHCPPHNWIPADSLPQAILTYISANYSNYVIDHGQKDSICPYGAVTAVMIEMADTVHLKLVFDATNAFLMTGQRIHYAATPQPVKDYVTANYADYHVCHGTELLTLGSGTIHYAIYLDKMHKHLRLILAADGTLICIQ